MQMNRISFFFKLQKGDTISYLNDIIFKRMTTRIEYCPLLQLIHPYIIHDYFLRYHGWVYSFGAAHTAAHSKIQ